MLSGKNTVVAISVILLAFSSVTASACSADTSAAGVAAAVGADGADIRVKKINSFAVKSYALMRQNLIGLKIALPRAN